MFRRGSAPPADMVPGPSLVLAEVPREGHPEDISNSANSGFLTTFKEKRITRYMTDIVQGIFAKIGPDLELRGGI